MVAIEFIKIKKGGEAQKMVLGYCEESLILAS